MTVSDIVDRVLRGDRRAAARCISLVENDTPGSAEISRRIFPHTGRAYRIGITGPPGVGKSTLVDKLTGILRSENVTVGIIAIDPTSPFSGGALLGDRVRMTDIGTDDGVFIRSMATRGNLGGLARTTGDAADILDAFGKDVIIFETVGVGQSELDVVEAGDTTVVVLMPESGDSVQAMKAGLMEIADIFVVNKADRDGADNTVLEIEAMMDLVPEKGGWRVPVVKTVASEGLGIGELREIIDRHHRFLKEGDRLSELRRRRIRKTVAALIRETVHRMIWNDSVTDELFNRKIDEIMAGSETPHSVAEEILRKKHLVKE